MIDILLITDQPRLHSIFASCANSRGINLRMANNLELAAQEITSVLPVLVFLQDRLSGLSAEIIGRHVRNLLPLKSATIVLLSDDSIGSQIQNSIDLCIDLQKSDEAVVAEIHNVIANLPTGPAIGIVEENTGIADEVADPVTISSASQPGIAPAGGGGNDLEPTAEQTPFLNRLESAIEGQDPVPIGLAEARRHLSELNPAMHGERLSDFMLREATPKRRYWPYAVIASIVLAATFYLLLGSKHQPAKPVTSQQLPVTTQAVHPGKLTQLPSFVPVAGLDRNYSKIHKGWERYADSNHEFKVFRDGTSIKALQIIDRSGRGISGNFIKDVLRETTAAEAYMVAATTEKDGFIVEKGAVENTAQIIVYRKKADRQIKGFVVSLN